MTIRRPYKTKKRKAEFKAAYREIGEINQTISNYETEIKVLLKHDKLDDAKVRLERIEGLKLELLEFEKKGFDIEYVTPMVSGYGVSPSTPELK